MNNPKPAASITVDDGTYERLPIKTHEIKLGDDLFPIIQEYVAPQFRQGDWIAISEKVVSVCQNNARHISTVKAGWLARFIVKFVKKYPDDIGFEKAEKMQVAVELAGRPRMMLAVFLGAISKIVRIRGVFWIIAGKRVAEIDGFNPDGMDVYYQYAILPPKNPEKVVQEIEDKLDFPAVIIDGNNINVKVISQSRGVRLDKKIVRLILLDNPMGQDDEMTPVIIVREKNS
jgi:F420-0:gamma-glutamyl ligase